MVFRKFKKTAVLVGLVGLLTFGLASCHNRKNNNGDEIRNTAVETVDNTNDDNVKPNNKDEKDNNKDNKDKCYNTH